MIGAIAGDIIGSVYEYQPHKSKEFLLFHPEGTFTDDSVLTIAIAQAVLGSSDYKKAVWDMGRKYPDAGYGGCFLNWLQSDARHPYCSWGNGAAMRVNPIGYAFDKVDTILAEAARTAAFTHNHPEGIKGAQATALAIYLARTTRDKNRVKDEVVARFGYDLDRSVEQIRPDYEFDVSCQGTVPEAIIAFLDSVSYEDAVRNAVSLGGDSDTLACITGGIAEAYYGPISMEISNKVQESLTDELWRITSEFYSKYVLAKLNIHRR